MKEKVKKFFLYQVKDYRWEGTLYDKWLLKPWIVILAAVLLLGLSFIHVINKLN